MSEFELEKAINYISEHPRGYRDDLIDELGKKIVIELGILGYICNGTTLHKRTYSQTIKAKKHKKVFFSKERRERESLPVYSVA